MSLVKGASRAENGFSLIDDLQVKRKRRMSTGHAESVNLRHKIITDYDEFLSLREPWNAIVRQVEGYSPSMSFEWMQAWVSVHRHEIERFYIIEFRDDSDLIVGIVPFYVTYHKKFGLKLVVLEVLGGRDRYLMDFVVNNNRLVEVLDATIKVIKKNLSAWDVVMFPRLNNRRASALHLERELRKSKLRFNTESYYRVPEIALRGDFESYYNNLKKHFRKEMRRKNRKLENLGSVKFTVHPITDDEQPLEVFLQLENNGWKGKNGSSLIKRKHLLNLYKSLIAQDRGCVEVLVFHMWLDNEVIASSICLKTCHAIFVNKITYHEAYGETSPGLHLRLYEIEYAMKTGLRIYSFSGVEKHWMSFFTRSGHYSMDFIVYSNHLIALIRYLTYTKLKPVLKNYPDFMSFVKERLHL